MAKYSGSAYFSPLVNMPVIIDEPGIYKTRSGEVVEITNISTRHDFNCFGAYLDSDIVDHWHKSGRLFSGCESTLDIISKAMNAPYMTQRKDRS